MGKRILIFNIVYYLVTLYFVMLGMKDPSSSLGYGYFIMGFWLVAGIVLSILIIRKILDPDSVLERIGMITATPVLFMAVAGLSLAFHDPSSTELHDYKDGRFGYMINTIEYKNSLKVKRIEIYKNVGPATSAEWVKDSTWLYFSESGDTLKKVRFKNGVEIK